jgi:DNA excision repair protein ERCC-3
VDEAKIITPLPDSTLIVDVDTKTYPEVRSFLIKFAVLEKSPPHLHTYRINPPSLWSAAASGLDTKRITEFLKEHSRIDVPEEILDLVEREVGKYGLMRLVKRDGKIFVESSDTELLRSLELQSVTPELEVMDRGAVKLELLCRGYPVEDLCGFDEGERYDISLKAIIRDYQRDAINSFTGDGVVVLPCGAGKTIVGIGIIARLKTSTLIICPNQVSVNQWTNELLDKTDCRAEDIGEYTAAKKEIKPITITTYQMLTFRRDCEMVHLELFNKRNWGLIIYDEVHLLPAEVFKHTANLQAKRRLGLTATFVREDGREKEVFTLIGPKRYEAPWKEIEEKGWIAGVECYEIRVPMDKELFREYVKAPKKEKYTISSKNPAKYEIVREIVESRRGHKILIIGQYIEQLEHVSRMLEAPLITGRTPNEKRLELYNAFRRGKIDLLVVSKVANFAIDLPDANVAVQLSGTFGSRQEEAQRLGRILRPKNGKAEFFSIITKGTRDQEINAKRQLFLTEQGYVYHVVNGVMDCQKRA